MWADAPVPVHVDVKNNLRGHFSASLPPFEADLSLTWKFHKKARLAGSRALPTSTSHFTVTGLQAMLLWPASYLRVTLTLVGKSLPQPSPRLSVFSPITLLCLPLEPFLLPQLLFSFTNADTTQRKCDASPSAVFCVGLTPALRGPPYAVLLF